jgi:hypothetical protein
MISICSAKNFSYVKSLEADAVFDYHDADKCVREIRGFIVGHGRDGRRGDLHHMVWRWTRRWTARPRPRDIAGSM